MCYQHTRLVRGVNNDAAKRIVLRLKSILSVESSSTAKKGARALWRATGRALVKKSARLFLQGEKRTLNWPWCNRMSKELDIFGQMVRLARPIATSLSQKVTVAGWPRSARMFLSLTSMRAAAKRPPCRVGDIDFSLGSRHPRAKARVELESLWRGSG